MPRKGKKRRKPRSTKNRHTPLSRYVRQGTKLSNPILGDVPFTPVDWQRDLLPEFLWLAGLADTFGEGEVHKVFYALMDAVDEVCPPRAPATPSTPDRARPRVEAIGLLSDFAIVPDDKRATFVSENEPLIAECFCKPIGRILAFYPENPAAWLVPLHLIEGGGPLDPEVELGRLRRLVREILNGKEGLAARLRTLPIARALKHGTFRFNAESEGIRQTVEAMEKYPTECTEEERGRVESFARSIGIQIYAWSEIYEDRAWSKYFWRHNFDLAPCRPRGFHVVGARPVQLEDVPELPEVLVANAEMVRAHLEQLAHRIRFDLYDPLRDEILGGLYARAARLYCLICELPPLWSRDVGGIIVRCLADTAITFAYLAKCGNDELFRRFKEYGEGQEKLLMLHLEGSHPGDASMEGRDAAMIAEELGGFAAELLHIELGSWAKKDARKLASAAGMERFYRLVFTPSSSDVHGTWVSLRQSNLLHCVEPLHRFHRIPSYVEPPAFLNFLEVAQELFEQCVKVGADVLGYPGLTEALHRVPEPVYADDRDEASES